MKIGLAAIWAIGVGSALGGDFFGWQFILWGGFGSAAFAVVFSGIFYWLYAKAISELAARYKTSGGSFDFVRASMGKNAAALMAVLGLLKLILANAGLALSISSYLIQADIPQHYQYLCWILTYSVFTLLDCIGVRQSANIQVAATILCVVILLIYSFSCFTKFSIKLATGGGLVHSGALGFFKGLPFALQFFDGFEEVPLLMGYARDPEKTIPTAITACFTTVSVIGLFVMIAGAGSSSADVLIKSEAPLMDGIDAVYGEFNAFSDIMAYVIVVGLVINFFAFVIFTSQQVQAIAEAGQLPSILAYRHPVHGAPINASIVSSIVGVVITAAFVLTVGSDAAQNLLVTAALMPAVLGYIVLLECIVVVRKIEERRTYGHTIPSQDTRKLGMDPGPLRFAYGVTGARAAQAMCFVLAVSLCVLAGTNTDFMGGLVVVVLLGVIGFGYMTYVHTHADDDTYVHELLNSEEDNPFGTNNELEFTFHDRSNSNRNERIKEGISL